MNAPDNRIYFDKSATEATLKGGKSEEMKDYLGKVAKLIPVEILSAYFALMSFVPSLDPVSWQRPAAWICFVACAFFTALYVGWRIGKGYEKQKHILVYVIAFVVWAYATKGDKLLDKPLYQEGLAGIALVITSLALGKVKLPAKKTP